jgi:hypothetical protein
MASVSWKGSIIDTYEKNTTFGGRSGESAKDADKQAVNFIHSFVDGVDAVGGFTPHATRDKSDMNVSDKVLDSVRTHSVEKSTYAIGKKYSEGVKK